MVTLRVEPPSGREGRHPDFPAGLSRESRGDCLFKVRLSFRDTFHVSGSSAEERRLPDSADPLKRVPAGSEAERKQPCPEKGKTTPEAS